MFVDVVTVVVVVVSVGVSLLPSLLLSLKCCDCCLTLVIPL